MFLCVFCLCSNAAEVARLSFSLPRLIETEGRTKTTMKVDVYLENSVLPKNLSIKAKLPAGVTYKSVEYSDRMVNPYLQVQPNVIENNPKYAQYLIMGMWPLTPSLPFSVTGNSGRIMTLTFELNNRQLVSGNYDIEFLGLSVGKEIGQPIKTPSVKIPFTVVSYLGDANNDGQVELADVNSATDMLLGQTTFIPEANVQYTDDVMTIGDITALIELLKNN